MKLVIFTIGITSFFIIFGIYQYVIFNDGKLHVTVCDVGQGDGVVMRTPRGHVVVFDGGPDQSILSCLDKSLPFWQKTIDLVLLSHPHADHLNGLVDIFDHFYVRKFATEGIANTSFGYKTLQKKVDSEGVSWDILEAGDRFQTNDFVHFQVVGPSKSFMQKTTSGGIILSSGEVPTLEILVSYRDFDIFLTGDSQHEELEEAISTYQSFFMGPEGRRSIEVLQVPHHGSRTGLTKKIVSWIDPAIATISSGKGNSYGHPAPEVLQILKEHSVEIYRTDQQGDLRLSTDGKSYNLR